MESHEDDEDRPRRRRRRREDYDDDDDDDDRYEDEDDDRPRRRRRRPPQDEGLEYVIPLNTSALAIAAGYVGLISVLCFPAPLALLLGILALRQFRRNPDLSGRYRAIFAIAMGAVFTIIPLTIAVIAVANEQLNK